MEFFLRSSMGIHRWRTYGKRRAFLSPLRRCAVIGLLYEAPRTSVAATEMILLQIITTKTYCIECDQELRDARDFAEHQRKHAVERIAPLTREMLLASGLKDAPDSHHDAREQ